jgi:plastocyanin
MKHRILLSIMAVSVIFVLAACSAVKTPAATMAPVDTMMPASSGSAVDVAISGFAFNPQSLTVKEGTTVTWTNQDSTIHTVTSDTGIFNSGNLSQGDKFSYTFTTAGTYAYHCEPHHASMTGTIVVTK